MMSNFAAQKEELDVLREIYYNEIQVRSDKPPISFSIEVKPQASNYEEPRLVDDEGSDESSGEDDADKPVAPTVELLFQIPESYPSSKPAIQVLNYTNLEEHEITELLDNLDKRSEESCGSVMIFILVSEIVEWLSTRAEKEAIEIELERGRRLEELEAEERKKAEGTPVTVETFLAWKAKFDAELLKIEIEREKRQTESNPGGQRGLTGREMFEKDKALAESDLNFVDDLELEEIEVLLQNIDELDVQEDYDIGTDEDASAEEQYDSDDKSS